MHRPLPIAGQCYVQSIIEFRVLIKLEYRGLKLEFQALTQ